MFFPKLQLLHHNIFNKITFPVDIYTKHSLTTLYTKTLCIFCEYHSKLETENLSVFFILFVSGFFLCLVLYIFIPIIKAIR